MGLCPKCHGQRTTSCVTPDKGFFANKTTPPRPLPRVLFLLASRLLVDIYLRCKSSGSLAMLAAMRRASSLAKQLARVYDMAAGKGTA
jgi:hypothetical protein